MKTMRSSILSHIITAATIVFGAVWVFPLYWAFNTALSLDTNTVLIPPAFGRASLRRFPDQKWFGNQRIQLAGR